MNIHRFSLFRTLVLVFLITTFFFWLIPPKVVRAVTFGISPPKIIEGILKGDVLERMITLYRTEDEGQQLFEVVFGGELKDIIQRKNAGYFVIEDGEKKNTYSLKIPTETLSVDKIYDGQITFVTKNVMEQEGVGVRLALGMKISLHVVSQPTLEMRAVEIGKIEQPEEALEVEFLGFQKTKKGGMLLYEYKNVHSHPLLPDSFRLNYYQNEQRTSFGILRLTKILDVNESVVIKTPFSGEKGVYQVGLMIGENEVKDSFEVGSSRSPFQLSKVAILVVIFTLISLPIFVNRKR